MLRKTIRFSVIAIPVFVLMIYLLRDRSPFGEKNTSFSVKHGKEITRIELKDNAGSLNLEKKGEEWFLNNKHETRKSSILFILKILKEMEIKSPVAPEYFNKEIVGNGIFPVRVKVYEKSKILRSFLVYKTASNSYGNIMKLKESSKPFIIYVPGSELEIGSAFTMNELFWQPYTVFNLLPSEIITVTLENIADTASSFRIKNENHTLRLFSQSKELSGWDTSRVIRFLSYFTHVPFESWAFNLSPGETEKIKNGEPLCRIEVVSSAGEKKVVTLWERTIVEKGVNNKDTDRLWAKTDRNDAIFIIRFTDIDPLLKKRSYFFPG